VLERGLADDAAAAVSRAHGVGRPVAIEAEHAGAPLGQARLPPPARLLVDADLGLVAMDADGLVAAARLSGGLGVVG
jgi:hypothetical protein